jgi:hypothetical protein
MNKIKKSIISGLEFIALIPKSIKESFKIKREFNQREISNLIIKDIESRINNNKLTSYELKEATSIDSILLASKQISDDYEVKITVSHILDVVDYFRYKGRENEQKRNHNSN